MNLKKIDPKFSKKTNPRIGLIALASDFIIEKVRVNLVDLCAIIYKSWLT